MTPVVSSAGDSRAGGAPGETARRVAGRGPLLPLLPQRPAWETIYSVGLVALDGLVITVAAMIALKLRFGDTDHVPSGAQGSRDLPYTWFAVFFAPVWVLLLAAGRSYEARFCGTGSEEFKRVTNATIRFTAVVAGLGFLARADL
ncbi:MAG: Undecaprenyl-phosphate galactosephosphotransferase, partial [Frankiales bacterium]|nr:Undecaprenyl-phosphate galactosephosphotransferase [Frankiales bacterium]